MTNETFARIKAALAITSGAPAEDKVTITANCYDCKTGLFGYFLVYSGDRNSRHLNTGLLNIRLFCVHTVFR